MEGKSRLGASSWREQQLFPQAPLGPLSPVWTKKKRFKRDKLIHVAVTYILWLFTIVMGEMLFLQILFVSVILKSVSLLHFC